MGVGVPEVVEMFATSICDTEPIVVKGSVESPSSQHGIKRQLSEASTGSPRSQSPCNTPQTPRSSRSERLSDSLSSPNTSSDTEQEEVVKRARLESPTSSDTDVATRLKESYISRRKRFLRTAEVLRQTGLLDITMKTAELLRKNQELQQEIENLQRKTRSFVLSVLSNPENRHILDNIRSGAQLYEVVVPGSQRIMSVSTHPPDADVDSAPLTMSNDSISNDSLSSHSNMSSPSPAPSVSSSSDDTSSLSDDIESSEEENLSPPKIFSSSKH